MSDGSSVGVPVECALSGCQPQLIAGPLATVLLAPAVSAPVPTVSTSQVLPSAVTLPVTGAPVDALLLWAGLLLVFGGVMLWGKGRTWR